MDDSDFSLEDIAKGRKVAEQEQHPDDKDELERTSLENAQLRSQIEILNETKTDIKTSRDMRIKYESKVFKFLVIYCLAAFEIIFLCGIGLLELHFSVLSVIAGSTAASAIGLVRQVGQGLFTDVNVK